MRVVRLHRFGDIEGLELGWSPVGKPLMTVYFYRVGQLIIDSGQRHMQKEAVEFASSAPVRAILLTHHHEDHSGNAAALRRATGAPVFGHPVAAEKLRNGFRVLPYQCLVWGPAEPVIVEPLPEKVEAPGATVAPVHAPGHSKDLTVYIDTERGVLFSGDLYIADRIKFFRSDERIADQIKSLRRVLRLDFDMLLCAHRPQKTGGKTRLKAKLQFLEDFLGLVTRLHDQGLSERQIMHALPFKEQTGTLWLTTGNVGLRHMVRSSLATLTTP